MFHKYKIRQMVRLFRTGFYSRASGSGTYEVGRAHASRRDR